MSEVCKKCENLCTEEEDIRSIQDTNLCIDCKDEKNYCSECGEECEKELCEECEEQEIFANKFGE